jgi:hypothetical protein
MEWVGMIWAPLVRGAKIDARTTQSPANRGASPHCAGSDQVLAPTPIAMRTMPPKSSRFCALSHVLGKPGRTSSQQPSSIRRIHASARPLGPIEPLLKDPTVNDIMINGHVSVYVERFGISSLPASASRTRRILCGSLTRSLPPWAAGSTNPILSSTRAWPTALASTLRFVRLRSTGRLCRSASLLLSRLDLTESRRP